MPKYAPLPGFRDFYPEDVAVRTYIQGTWREVARRYGFQEYDGPPLEPLELYVDKSGPEIVAQLYHFVDQGGRAVALRPEMTPTLARMVAARASALPKPIKWFSIPQLFRYERPQRGRLREHFQLNLDIVGESGIGADVELLAAAIDVLRAFGLGAEDVVVRLSSRRLLGALFASFGVPPERAVATFAIVDKIEREDAATLERRLRAEAQLPAEVAARVLRVFAEPSLEDIARRYGGHDRDVDDELERLAALQDLLRAWDLDAFVTLDLRIVRGLAYYTGIVWEIFDRQRTLRALAGGGRYDRLLAQVGGVDLPALGFGMGDVVLGELLRERGLLPTAEPAVDYYVVAITPEDRPEALRLVRDLREAGHRVDYALHPQPLGRQLKAAAARQARAAVLIGPEERATGRVVVRDLATGQQEVVDRRRWLHPEASAVATHG
jgi:histidyl-tRNA synthetase